MNMSGNGFWRLTATVAAALAFSFCAGCLAGEAVEKGAAAEKAKPASNADEKAKAPDKAARDPFAVPDGPPDKQVEFLKSLSNLRPDAPDEQTAKEFNAKVAPAALAAAEKILAGKPTDEQAEIAVQVKAEVLGMKAQQGDQEASKKLKALPDELEKAGLVRLARRLRAAAFQERVVLAQAAGDDDLKKVVAEIAKFLSSGPVGPTEAELALSTSQALERSGHKDLAIAANRDFAKLFAKSEVKQIARFAKRLEGTARRLGLPGNVMPLEGSRLDGQPLQWDKYRGKVVLVSFWATWCGPCRQEIKSIRKNYEAYHDRGFEVVAISVDEDRKELEEFVEENKLPWTVVFDHALRGEDDKSMATHYGVSAIPEVILVDKEGKVVATEVRGRALDAQLEKLLGPAPEAKKTASDKRP